MAPCDVCGFTHTMWIYVFSKSATLSATFSAKGQRFWCIMMHQIHQLFQVRSPYSLRIRSPFFSNYFSYWFYHFFVLYLKIWKLVQFMHTYLCKYRSHQAHLYTIRKLITCSATLCKTVWPHLQFRFKTWYNMIFNCIQGGGARHKDWVGGHGPPMRCSLNEDNGGGQAPPYCLVLNVTHSCRVRPPHLPFYIKNDFDLRVTK